ncbi:MAG: hypothetical protein NT124_01645 [Candidatus Dependentiae bacterium]|nr:hypothetical protein [Candidatus Dependentiae bacterium]
MNNQKKKNNTAYVLFFVLLVGISSNLATGAAAPVRGQARRATQQQKAPVQSLAARPVSGQPLASIPYLSAVNSAKAAREVRQTIHDHKMGSRVLNVVGIGQQLYGFYQLKEQYFAKPSDNISQRPQQQQFASQGWGESLSQGFSNLISPSKWSEWSLSFGKFACVLAGHAVTQMAINKALETVNHEDTIFWFIEKQTSYQQSMQDLITYAQLLEKNEGTQEDKTLHKKAFVHTARDLMHQIEKIVGYIKYKASIIKNHASVLGDIAQDTVSKTNRIIGLLNTEINRGDVVTCTALLQEFSSVIDTAVDRSAAFDPDADTQRHNQLMAKNREFAKVGRAIVRLPKVAQDKVDTLLQEYSK